MRTAPLVLVILATALTGCTTFKARPLSDVTPPRPISIRSTQPFVAQSANSACRVTMLTGPFATVTRDSIFIASVSDVERALDQQTACTPSGRTAVAIADLRVTDGARVLSRRLSFVKSALVGYVILIGGIVTLGGF